MSSSPENAPNDQPATAAAESPPVGPQTPPRAEAEVFADLEALCTSPGYVYALAWIHLTNDSVLYSKTLKPTDLLPSYSQSRLIRSELSTLFGLMIKNEVSHEFQGDEVTSAYVDRSFRLLEELHRAIDSPGRANFVKALTPGGDLDSVMTHGGFLREAMFYGAESAFAFQYIDLAKDKYRADDAWLLQHKGFTSDDAAAVILALTTVQPDRMIEVIRLQPRPLGYEFPLTALALRPDDLVEKSGVTRERVDAVIAAFSVAACERNRDYKAASDFNVANATPLFKLPDGRVVSFHTTSLAAALYETPFFWIVKDKTYFHQQAQGHRGDFAERFCARRLERIFGAGRVFTNVLLKNPQNHELAEIDILVRYGNRALVFQVKSKRLTLDAQKGIEDRIRDDFQKGVQKAYDQGFNCIRLIQAGGCTAITRDGTVLDDLHAITHFYPLCVLSDHYPALAHQARHLIQIRKQDGITAPLVLDIFMIDEMTELLPSPLYFLSYVDRRVGYDDRVMASSEHVLFAYHLKQNLWLESDIAGAGLTDDWGVELDVAMLARRTGVPGAKVPPGILTSPRRRKFGELLQRIEHSDDPVVIELGLFLLTMGEQAVTELNKGIDKIVTMARRDGRSHDFSMGMKDSSQGVTLHCSNLPPDKAQEGLIQHCAKRKHLDRKDIWFGIWIGPGKLNVRLVAELNYAWTSDGTLFAAASKRGTQMPYPADGVSIGEPDVGPSLQ